MRVYEYSGINLDRIMAEINHDINLLYIIPCVYTRNLVLNHLRDRISMFESVTDAAYVKQTGQQTGMQTDQQMNQQADQKVHQQIGQQNYQQIGQQIAQGNLTSFTLQELSRFNGKSGNPAYVAVNGIVYDVTNNAAWAAATHFGLTAGRDLTSAFASCHAGQPILSKLEVVGRLQTMQIEM